jgi:DNA-binding XRE family transcriptional regulator
MTNAEAEKIVNAIIARLKEARVTQSISHEKLAEMTKLHRSTISLIESRKRQPTLLTCVKIADALNIELRDIV